MLNEHRMLKENNPSGIPDHHSGAPGHLIGIFNDYERRAILPSIDQIYFRKEVFIIITMVIIHLNWLVQSSRF